METTAETAIRRKLSGARVGRAPIPEVEEIGENFAKLLDERLRGLVRTITSAIVLDCEVRKLSAVLEDIPVPAMLALVDVRGSQNAAMINIGSDLMFHIVDLRMGGDAAAAPMPTARSVTAIDCALCEEFIRLTLEAFEAALRLHLGAGLRSAMTLERFEQHVTMVRIAPEHSDVLVVRLSLDMGEAARSGDFDLVLPLAVLDSYRAAATGTSHAAERARPDIWSRRMARAAADAPVRLRAELHRERMRLADLQTLEVGSLLPLPREAREAVELRIEGSPDGEPLARGRLGAVEGKKAVKVIDPPEPGRADGLRRILGHRDGLG